jgi:HPt (histidine-containing phosphotransfer) domain-containing protein
LVDDLIDTGVVAELKSIGGNGALFNRVTALFMKNVPVALRELKELAIQKDVAGLAESVHALKSMCASLGAKKAANTCNELEVLARTGKEFNAPEMVGVIVHQAHASMERLRAIAQT